MPGTNIGRVRYAMLATYWKAHGELKVSSYAVATPCPVLTNSMLLSSYAVTSRCPVLTYNMLVPVGRKTRGSIRGRLSTIFLRRVRRCPVLRQGELVPDTRCFGPGGSWHDARGERNLNLYHRSYAIRRSRYPLSCAPATPCPVLTYCSSSDDPT
eukprot:2033201-Rhodomonas_salina.2